MSTAQHYLENCDCGRRRQIRKAREEGGEGDVHELVVPVRKGMPLFGLQLAAQIFLAPSTAPVSRVGAGYPGREQK